MDITEEQLRDLNACKDGIKYFKSLKSHNITDVYISVIKDEKTRYFEFLCKNIPISKDNLEVKRVLIKTKRAEFLYYYLGCINRNDKEVKQAFLATKDAELLYYYLGCINRNDKEVKQALIETKDAKHLSYYLEYINDMDEEIRRAIREIERY